MRLLIVAAALTFSTIFFSATSPHGDVTRQLQTDQGRIEWTGKAAVGEYELTGTVKPKSGSLTIGDHGAMVVGGEVVIDLTTMEHEIGDVVDHLGHKDFLHVKKFPTATLTLTKKVKMPCQDCQATAELEFRGEKKVQAIGLSFSKEGENVICVFDFTMDRTQWGMIANSPDHFPNIDEGEAVHNDVRLKGRLVF